MERAFQGFGESGYLGCVRCLPRESGDAEYDQCDDHRGNGRIKHIPDMREKGRVRYGGRQYGRV